MNQETSGYFNGKWSLFQHKDYVSGTKQLTESVRKCLVAYKLAEDKLTESGYLPYQEKGAEYISDYENRRNQLYQLALNVQEEIDGNENSHCGILENVARAFALVSYYHGIPLPIEVVLVDVITILTINEMTIARGDVNPVE